jgi:hypothetical protein
LRLLVGDIGGQGSERELVGLARNLKLKERENFRENFKSLKFMNENKGGKIIFLLTWFRFEGIIIHLSHKHTVLMNFSSLL